MAAVDFDYVAALSYEEAIDGLSRGGEDAKILAGGQSLVPMMNLRLVRPELVVDVNPIGAKAPTADSSTLVLDALTRHRTLFEDATVRKHCPLLADAVRFVGNPRVRNRGTIGGSLAHCDPTAELGASSLVLGADVVVQGPRGNRTVPVDALFVSYLTTSLDTDEIITQVRVPVKRRHEGWGFAEMVRRTSDLAIVVAAARIRVDEDGVACDVALSFAGVAERVILAEGEAVGQLVGSTGDEETIRDVGESAAAALDPPNDVHASARYRKRVAGVLARRALRAAFERALWSTDARTEKAS